MTEITHVMPIPHEESVSCWCRPEVVQECSESYRNAEDEVVCLPGCWRCQGEAWVPPYDEELALLVIHNAEEA